MPMVLPDYIEMVDGKRVCKHNREVFCPVQALCFKCGWNPANKELRAKRRDDVMDKREAIINGLGRT